MRKLAALEKKYLSRRECWLCGQTLDKDWCSAIYEKCPPEVMEARRIDCLSHYKPRGAVTEPPDV